jgi:hypothetical protein
MTPSLPEILIGVVAFAIAFGIAKFISVRKRHRNQVRDRQLESKAQSRQVRRARERKGR